MTGFWISLLVFAVLQVGLTWTITTHLGADTAKGLKWAILALSSTLAMVAGSL